MNDTTAHPKSLICFAHHGEAQAFLSYFDFKPKNFFFEGLFESEKYFLLLTQEGEQSTSERITAVLSALHDQIQDVVNLGIVGALSSKLQLEEIVHIRTSYGFQNNEPKFKSFPLKGTHDCISSEKRVINRELAEKLSCFAQVVDRELWAVASSCHLMKKSLSAIKIVSDNPLIQSSSEICEPVREKALVFSEKLLQEFLKTEEKLATTEAPTRDIFSSPYFHFTVSMKHQYEELSSRLNTHDELEAIASKLQNEKIPAKVRTQKLLQELRSLLNPLQRKIQQRTEDLKTEMAKKNILIKFSENFETNEIQFQFAANNSQELETKVESLKEFSFEKAHKILNGQDL